MTIPGRIIHTAYASPLGRLYAAFSADGLLRLDFSRGSTQRAFAASLPGAARGIGPRDDPLARQLEEELAAYFAGRDPPFRTPLDLSAGTPFQQRVWRALRSIPFGTTVSYGDVARRIGKPKAARAVGQAIGANPVGIVVPCHRVIRGSGREAATHTRRCRLGGFGAGLPIKRWLLRHEGRL